MNTFRCKVSCMAYATLMAGVRSEQLMGVSLDDALVQQEITQVQTLISEHVLLQESTNLRILKQDDQEDKIKDEPWWEEFAAEGKEDENNGKGQEENNGNGQEENNGKGQEENNGKSPGVDKEDKIGGSSTETEDKIAGVGSASDDETSVSECSSSDVDCVQDLTPDIVVPEEDTTTPVEPEEENEVIVEPEVDLNVLCSGIIEEYQAIILAANNQQTQGEIAVKQMADTFGTIVSSTVPFGKPAVTGTNVIDTVDAEIANPANNYARETFFKVQEVAPFDTACAGKEAEYLATLDQITQSVYKVIDEFAWMGDNKYPPTALGMPTYYNCDYAAWGNFC